MPSKSILSTIRESGTALVIIMIVAAYLIWRLSEVFFLIFGSILIAVLLTSLISFIRKRARIPWRISFLITVIIVFGLLGIFFYSLFSIIISQFTQLSGQFPGLLSTVGNRIEAMTGLELGDEFDVSGLVTGFLSVDLLRGTIGAIFSLFFVLVLSLYFSYDPGFYKESVMRLSRNRARANRVFDSMRVNLKNWMIGTFFSMVAIGILTTIGLFILGIKFALILGILAGFFEVIPYFGPIISWIPAVLVAFAQDPILAIYVTALYILIQFLESHLIVPLIQQRAVSIPPAYYVINLFVFGLFFGVLGVFFAAPILVIIIAVIRSVKKERQS